MTLSIVSRFYSYTLQACLGLWLLLVSCQMLAAGEIVLLDQGKSDYQIVVPDELPSPALTECLQQTARLLQTAFAANGVEVPVVTETQRTPTKPTIFLGNTKFAAQHGVDLKSLTGWGYVQRVVGRDVIIAGRDHPSPDATSPARNRRPHWDRYSTAVGVTDFLRRFAGVRFLYPDVPPTQSIAAAAKVDLLKSPAIEYLATPRIVVPDDWNVRKIPLLEYNTAYPATGGFYDVANNRYPLVDEVFGGHTYERAVPVEKYAQTHPEYFALIGGQRVGAASGGAQAQFCISNPDVQELIYKDMIEHLDRGYQAVDVGQPDGFRACQCEACNKLFDTGNDWNEKLWLFHRQLAERVLKARPGKQVVMVSYIQTAEPPKSFKKFPANTVMMLTGTNDEDFAPWREAEVPGGFGGYLYNWCPNMGTRYTPMRTPRYVETQAKRLQANHIRSIYRDGPGSLWGLEGPVYYTMNRMYDDPATMQAKLLVHEFCEAAFGRSAPVMLQFYDQLYHAIELYSEFLGTRNPAWTYHTIYGQRRKFLTDSTQFLAFFYTPSLLESLETQLAAAEKLANSDKIKTRLALVRREFDYLKGVARVAHLYHAYQIQPDLASRDRLLAAIDARNAEVASYYDARGRTKLGETWAYTLFPPPGHDVHHLKLEHNGYQEPYANSVFNWDTQAMRNAPLPGAKRVTASPASGEITLDAPQWKQVDEFKLGDLPSSASVSRATSCRVLFDATALHVRVESELPAALQSRSADQDPTKQESLAVYLSPTSNRELAYRLTVGLRPDAKQDAVTGIIGDPIHPLYGKFDNDWSGEWQYESRFDSATNRWVALVSVPYKTLGVTAPAPGAFWRMNVSRVHLTEAGAVERSVWSATASSKTPDEVNDFGELLFGKAEPVKNAQSSVPPLTKLRQDLYAKTFESPAAWQQLKHVLPQALGPWSFRKDPLEQGQKQQWYQAAATTAEWTPITVPSFWAENEAIGKFEGYGWYRTTLTLPSDWQGKSVRVHFGSIDEQAWVYVNGELMREHTEASERKSLNELWETPFFAEIPAAKLKRDQPNVLVVRVHNSLANGGLWRPVIVQGMGD